MFLSYYIVLYYALIMLDPPKRVAEVTQVFKEEMVSLVNADQLVLQ